MPTIIPKLPDSRWLERLRPDDHIWLVKERQLGIIESVYQPPASGFVAGKLCFRRQIGTCWKNETWLVRPDGKGFDYGQLFLPVEGHLSDCPSPIFISEIREIYQELAQLKVRLTTIEDVLGKILIGWHLTKNSS